MTDEEFERLKKAEKKHLQEKKRMRRMLEALKKRNRAEGIVRKMKQGAQRLLRETESLVDTLRSQVARNEAQLEVAIEESGRVDDLPEDEEALREERAESLVRQYKAASGPVSSQSAGAAEGTERASGAETDAEASPSEGPEKTIGRMRTPRSGDADSEERT